VLVKGADDAVRADARAELELHRSSVAASTRRGYARMVE
jgi:hypothetical protein